PSSGVCLIITSKFCAFNLCISCSSSEPFLRCPAFLLMMAKASFIKPLLYYIMENKDFRYVCETHLYPDKWSVLDQLSFPHDDYRAHCKSIPTCLQHLHDHTAKKTQSCQTVSECY